MCTEKILDVKKNSSEISYSGSLDNYSSDSDSVNSSGKYDYVLQASKIPGF